MKSSSNQKRNCLRHKHIKFLHCGSHSFQEKPRRDVFFVRFFRKQYFEIFSRTVSDTKIFMNTFFEGNLILNKVSSDNLFVKLKTKKLDHFQNFNP